ncbi:NAD kinase [Mycetocola tolaasinivorans]|uniref:NAD kinase n=1 Tax=Mycetocola tolaasinivorans TaxID=76635 RepID=A0A3L7A008_9MICO|nr:NAD kinase [Mycetocola tolaasinivorans]RLP73310.1 NAD kinase [Mycetocola tolaasinivorans]
MTTAHLRPILVVSHTGRDDSIEAAIHVINQLRVAGANPVLERSERDDICASGVETGPVLLLDEDVSAAELEIVIVLGGDGTILRAAELVRRHPAPLLGINLGHVGFLAESERDDLDEAVRRAISGEYIVEERLTLAVSVEQDGEVVYENWALNEATVEKASRERMLEVLLEVDDRPLSSFGCDGVVVSTPTGSTAYGFSAGGPVIWPTVEAIMLVPLSAHALFARPLVVSPASSIGIRLLERNVGTGVLWCDGRRAFELGQGAQVSVRRSSVPVRLARLHQGPFTDRLVQKFRLPVTGWRGDGK